MNKDELNLNSYEIRSVRGKYLPTTASIEARYRIDNDNVELVGYVENTQYEDFSKRVRKTFTNALNFAKPKRDLFNAACDKVAELAKSSKGSGLDKYIGRLEAIALADELKAGRRLYPKAFAAIEAYVPNEELTQFWDIERDFRKTQNEIFLDTTTKMRNMLSISELRTTTYDKEVYNDKDAIRHLKNKPSDEKGQTTLWSGYDSDREQIDLITEAELLTVYIFDKVDATKMDDESKAQIALYAASRVAKERLNKSENVSLPKTIMLDKPTNYYERLMGVFDKYVKEGRPYSGGNNTESNELHKDLDNLKNNIKAKYGDDAPISVKRTLSEPKKRGDGFTSFKSLTSKHMEELGLDEDDFGDDW